MGAEAEVNCAAGHAHWRSVVNEWGSTVLYREACEPRKCEECGAEALYGAAGRWFCLAHWLEKCRPEEG